MTLKILLMNICRVPFFLMLFTFVTLPITGFLTQGVVVSRAEAALITNTATGCVLPNGGNVSTWTQSTAFRSCTASNLSEGCLKDDACDQYERAVKEFIGPNALRDFVNGTVQRVANLVTGTASGVGCLLSEGSFGKCIFVPMMGWLGSWFLTLGGYMLQLAAYVFNTLVEHLIVGFGQTIQQLKIIDGIHKGWTILRDISNIVIIGVFTFIAISIIIGNQTFGEKKLVARVLVIAVLINFSLLFTKIIIDSSNFVAYQIHKNMGGSSDTGSNISGKFLAIMGITNLLDTHVIAQKYGKSLYQAGDSPDASGFDALPNTALSGFGAFLYGVVGGTLLLFAAGILFYGSYLIAVRAVLLVFLMLSSAIAFASYLIPSMSDGEYGWHTWWKSLINAAVFGPLMMILLYISLVILSAANGEKRSVALNGAIINPERINDTWPALIIYILGIGMLYVSFRVANSFSHKIAGFPRTIPNLVNPLTPLLASSRLMGLVGRSSVGKMADRAHEAMKQRQTNLKWQGKTMGRAGMLATRMFGDLKTRTFDPANTRPVSKLLSAAHGPSFMNDAGKGGYSGVKKRQTDHAVHVATANTEKVSDAEGRANTETQKRLAENIRKELEKTREEIKAQGGAALDQAKASSEDRKILAQQVERAVAEKDAPSQSEAPQSTEKKAPSPEEITRGAQEEHVRSEERHEIQNAGNQRIVQAQETAVRKTSDEMKQVFGSSSDELLAQFDANLKEKVMSDLKQKEEALQKDLADLKRGVVPEGRRAQFVEDVKKVKGELHDAAHGAEKSFAESIAAWAPGRAFGDNKAMDSIAGALKKHAKEDQWKDVITGIKKQIEGGDGHGGGAHAPTAAKPADNHDAHPSEKN